MIEDNEPIPTENSLTLDRAIDRRSPLEKLDDWLWYESQDTFEIQVESTPLPMPLEFISKNYVPEWSPTA